MDYASIIAAITQILGPIAGQAAAKADKDMVFKLLQDSLDEYGQIQVPKLKELTAELIPDSELSKIQDDPQYKLQQYEADHALRDVANAGGLTLDDKAALNQIRNRIAASETTGRQAIANQMAARGTLDSGAQLAMQLDNQQASANRAAEAGENTAAQAQKRAYEAILARSRLAGEGLDRDYRQKFNAAAAQDAINRGNADIRNLTNRFNSTLPTQNLQNQLAVTGARAHARNGMANLYQDRGDRTADTWTEGSIAAAQGIRQGFGGDQQKTTAQAAQQPRQIIGYDSNGQPVYSSGSNPYWSQL